MPRIAPMLLIVLVSMLLWGFPYCLVVAALVRGLVEALFSRWREGQSPLPS